MKSPYARALALVLTTVFAAALPGVSRSTQPD